MTPPIELLLGRTLGIGVGLSTVLLGSGLLLALIAPGAVPDRLLQAGVIVLMATPMMRVLISCVEYVRERDWFFAVSAFGVLVVLAVTIYTAWRH